MFTPEGFSNTIFKERYALTPEETWEECSRRVAKQMALAESAEKQKTYENKFFDIISRNEFVPGGRIFYNSGRNNPQLLNCFLLTNQLDSKEGWAQLAYEMIVTSMTGGGCGQDFSDVRPRGAPVGDQRGECPGPVELMRLIDACAKPVRNGGARRVALMFSLDLDHPDIEEFLDAKLTRGELTYANVSVRVKRLEEFQKAVKEDGDWELSWKGKFKKTIKAKPLWSKIVQNAYNSAEPGVLNWELALNESNIWYIEDLVSTNPCFTGETLIKTKDGFKTFASLSDTEEVDLVNYKGDIVKGSIWSNGLKPIVSVRFSNGEVIRCTPDHRFMLTDGEECQAKDLKGKRVLPFISLNEKNDEFTKLGFIQGDGNLTRLLSKEHKGLEINIGEKDQDISNLFNIDYENESRTYYVLGYNDILKDLGFQQVKLPERTLPETFNNWSMEQKKSFFRGLYSANGSVIKSHRVSFKSTCFDLISQMNEFLSILGISSYITTNKAKSIAFNNGTYLCKESYDLNISTYDGCLKFANDIGFVHKYKQNDLIDLLKLKSPVVTSIKMSGEEEVYDFNLQDNTHWGVVKGEDGIGGYTAHNCGEIAMSSYDCCCLGHLVLPRFISDGKLDYARMGNTIRTAVRFLDNVLTVNSYPLPQMREKSHKLRRIGLGTTGLADALALIGIKYGSKEGNDFIDKLYKFIAKVAYESSVMLAVEKGAFPACNPEKHVQSGFMKRMPAKIRSLVQEHGIRNCAILTQAPTGTVSILSGNCSSGIEPMFSYAYERRYYDKDIRKTELVFHPLFKEFMEQGKDVTHFVASHELDVKQHMEVQATVQKWVDNAVSKTINMANDYPMEKMEEAWIEFLPKLKGTTFYRDGTRGLVKADGTMEEPPLKPLELEEAKRRFNEAHAVDTEFLDDCASGSCEWGEPQKT